MIPASRLDALQTLAAEATPGPWHVPEGQAAIYAGKRAVASTWGDNLYENAPFIAAADPTTVLALITELREARAARCPVPTDEGGYGHEDTYWLRSKLNAAITHLRDVEDYYRILGGLPEGFNQIRADRARQLSEAITEDFVNGKTSRLTGAEARAALEALIAWDARWPDNRIHSATLFKACHDELSAIVARARAAVGGAEAAK